MPRNDKELSEIPSGKIKMGKSFFQNVRDRIETVRPEEGDYIRVEPQSGYGLKISGVLPEAGNYISIEPNSENVGYTISGKFNVVTINVCSNGTLATISVLAPI